MSANVKGEAPLRSDHDIVLARQQVRRLTQELKFLAGRPDQDGHRGERARAQCAHLWRRRRRWSGRFSMAKVAADSSYRFADEGPGIPNLDLAMTDGWTSGKGLGMGLTGHEAARQRIRHRHQSGRGHPRDDRAMDLLAVTTPHSERAAALCHRRFEQGRRGAPRRADDRQL